MMEQKRQWKLPEPLRLPPEVITAAGDAVVAEILFRRGYKTADEIRSFLSPDVYKPFSFSEHPLVQVVVERIEQAVINGERITIYGDYDVDGMTSTAVWMETLRCLGATVTYHVPDRFEEGYGMNMAVLQELANTGTNLIITCDCGISNRAEIAAAKSLGMDVVVTDHHELPEQLPEVPIFNPKLLHKEHPAYDLPGVGVSYVVAEMLLQRAGQGEYADALLEFVALGVIADVVSLTRDNRYYVKKGLPNLLSSKRPGIKALLAAAKMNPMHSTEEDIAFQVIPRLNAAGRLDNARLAVELLLAQDEPEARALANQLDRLNETRKLYCDQTMQEAIAKIGDGAVALHAIALYQETWPEGVVGIVAGRLAEQYEKPALLMTRKENGLVTGSARSVSGINIYYALTLCQDLLHKFGGHDGAAGFSLSPENVVDFCQRINDVIAGMMEEREISEPQKIDALLPLERINLDFYRKMRQLAPFGQGNPRPLFLVDEATIASNQLMREGSLHRRLRLTKHGACVEAVWWNSAGIDIGNRDKVIAALRLNVFREVTSMQLDIQDVLDSTAFRCVGNHAHRQIIDCRGQTHREVRKLFPQAVFFAEGVEQVGTVGHAEITPAHVLVFLTIPVTVTKMEDIITAANPQQIVVAWETLPREWSTVVEDTWQNLMGMIKHAVRVCDGEVILTQFASRLDVTDEIVKAGIAVLTEVGLVEASVINQSTIKIKIQSQCFPDLRQLKEYRQFVKMLAELAAFRTYVGDLPEDELALLILNKTCVAVANSK
jgi:single-stranded-DNA-specific exonuclease